MLRSVVLCCLASALAVVTSGAGFDDENAARRKCATDEHLITKLPGVRNRTFEQTFCQYSGHIPVSESKRLFYWLTESQTDPDDAPLVLWLNGGPGCSSLGGFLSELGPFRPSKGGTGLKEYPHSWNRIANVLFLESPAGVGFSYSNSPEDDYVTGDDQTTYDAHIFLLRFLEKFPRYQGREFWITGESYAGHYIPLLSTAIVAGNRKGVHPHINLKGYLLGNPSTDHLYDGYGEAFMWFSHNLISDATYAGLKRYCGYAHIAREIEGAQDGELDNLYNTQRRRSVRLDNNGQFVEEGDEDDDEEKVELYKSQCSMFNGKAHEEMASVNIYDIYVDVCRQHPHDATHYMHEIGHSRHPHAHWARKMADEKYHPCLDNYLPEYLDRKDVRRALHIDGADLGPWQQCSNTIDYSREDHLTTMIPIHRKLAEEGLHILIFSGDVDGMIPAAATRFWLQALRLPTVGEWQHWTVEDQVAGYTQEYAHNLVYSTIRDGGHMAPETQPARAFEMFRRFITYGRLVEPRRHDDDASQ